MAVATNGEDPAQELENLAEKTRRPRRTRERAPNSEEFLARARELKAALDALDGPYWAAREAYTAYTCRYFFRRKDGTPVAGLELVREAEAGEVS